MTIVEKVKSANIETVEKLIAVTEDSLDYMPDEEMHRVLEDIIELRNILFIKQLEVKELDVWAGENEQELTCLFAETGMDREMDFNREYEEEKLYEEYVNKLTKGEIK